MEFVGKGGNRIREGRNGGMLLWILVKRALQMLHRVLNVTMIAKGVELSDGKKRVLC